MSDLPPNDSQRDDDDYRVLQGQSIGADFLLRHLRSKVFTGWVAYTLSRATRRDSGSAEQRLFDFDQTFRANVVWMPDNRGLAYLDARSGTVNVWMQPLGGGKPVQLTDSKVSGLHCEIRLDDRDPEQNAVHVEGDELCEITGLVFTPNAFAIAPLSTEAKIPTVIMNAGTSAINASSAARLSSRYSRRSIYSSAWAIDSMVCSRLM